MDLLNIRWLRNLLKSRWFPFLPQIILLCVFCLLVAGSLCIKTNDTDFAKTLRNTNLANLIVWAYWWPILVVSAVFLGRMWCMVCPMELVNSLAARFGLRRPAPDFLKSKWIMTIFYGVILYIGVFVLAIHRVPHRMALYMLVLFGAAVVAGLIFEKRAFCNHICPVGPLLGLYACISPFEWRVRESSVCSSCTSKDCISKDKQYRIAGRSCTSNLFPASIRDNRDCLLCTQCLKVCPNYNLRLSARKPFTDFFCGLNLKAAEVGFIIFVSSFVIYDILPEWPVTDKILYWVPRTIGSAFGVSGINADLLSGGFLFVIFPFAFLLTAVGLTKIFSAEKSGDIARGFTLLLLPSVGCAHMVKSLFKMSSRLPYFSYAFSDTAGVETANKIVSKEIVPSQSLPKLIDPVLNYAAVVVMLAVLVVTLLILRKSEALKKFNAGAKACLFAGVFAYWAAVTLAILMWRF